MLLLLLSLQAEAATVAADTLRKTRAEKCFEAVFEGECTVAGKRIGKKGSGLRCAPGILLLDIETVGGKRTRAVRVGERAWVYSLLGRAWLAHDDTDEAGVAHGLLNPDKLLSLLAEHAPNAKAKGADLEIQVEGAKAVALANALVPNQEWTQARAAVLLQRDAQGLLASVHIDASVRNAQGPADLSATFKLGRFGQVAVPAALGTVPFSPEVAAAIADQLK
ncbi:MAG TPA: hypothetical protein VF950_13180 [Planctomycetota bacterium]